MKRPSRLLSILFFVFIGLLTVFHPQHIFAHPIDIASLVVSVNGQEGPKGGYILPVTWSFTIPELAAITTFARDNPSPKTGIDVMRYLPVLSPYLHSVTSIVVNHVPCTWDTSLEPEMVKQLDLTLIAFHSNVLCPSHPESIEIVTSAFVKQFPYQTNIVILSRGEETIQQKELNKLQTKFVYPEPSEEASQNQPKDPSGSGFITKHIETKLKDLLIASLPLALLVSFLVGFLHSMEAGHSKTILASLMLHKEATIRQGLAYSLVFTITHIADILLFGVLFIVLNSFVDIYGFIGNLNRYAIFVLLWLSMYMLVKNLLEVKKNKEHEHMHEHGIEHNHDHGEQTTHLTFGKQLWIGFITGLAPCVMGWSIFFVILSTKSIWAVFPVILSFGGGIYLSLIMTTILVYAGRNTILKRISWLSVWSPVLSSLLLVLFSILLLIAK